MLKHFVVTRLGLAVYGEQVLAELLDLFELVTLPSLLQQSGQDFIWIIVVDSGMPQVARCRLEQLLQTTRRAYLLEIDVTALTHVRQGCFDWVWDRCQDFLLERGLVDDPAEYVVTSVIDADDAWHFDTLRLVQGFMTERLSRTCLGVGDRGTWLQHTFGIAATFEHGYKWFISTNAWERTQQPFMSMSVFVAARFSSGISACSSRHLGWPHYSKVVGFSEHVFEQEDPMWVWVRHSRTTQPWTAAALSVNTTSSPELYHKFGIDAERLLQWRNASGRSGILAHAGRSASDQYDRIFRIAGLNRQIKALSARRGPTLPMVSTPVTSLDEAIARKKTERAALVQTLRACGADM